MKLVVSQPMFFPWIGFFEQIKLCDIYVHYVDVQYSKGGFTNRVQVKSPSGVKWLTVPLKNIHLGQPIDQVQIDNHRDWRTSHLGLLKWCYAEAPFYAEMMQVVETIYSQEWDLLDELSQATLKVVCEYFGFYEKVRFMNIKEMDIPGASSERVLDTVLRVGADVYITGHGARRYLNHDLFEKAGIKVEYINYKKTPYPQLYGEFTPYVSILDLIANVGRDGNKLIHSATTDWKDFINE
jgi:hypothetical protein